MSTIDHFDDTAPRNFNPSSREGARRRMEAKGHTFPPPASKAIPVARSIRRERLERAMASRRGRQARILSAEQVDRVIAHLHATSNSPLSDEAKVLLSFYAGLRASEIASLMMADVCDAEGRIGRSIYIRPCNAKNKMGRTIPMHGRIRDCLKRLRAAHPEVPFIAFSNRWRVKKQSAGTLADWFHALYRSLGLEGCSSHSGRRSFITNLARSANAYNTSLRDVQILAGHSRLDTTERYIDRADDLSALIGSLGEPRGLQP